MLGMIPIGGRFVHHNDEWIRTDQGEDDRVGCVLLKAGWFVWLDRATFVVAG